MKRTSLIAAVAAFIAFGGHAHEPVSDSCSIEDWSWKMRGNYLYLNGRTTCTRGILDFSLYHNGNYLLSSWTPIRGHVFEYVEGDQRISGGSMTIRYSVRKR